MKKIFFLLLMLSAFSLGALDVDVEELKSAGRDVIFVNYEGPHERIDTAAEIKGVGRFLAESLKRTGTVGKYLLKYRIIRAVDEGQQGKFDADIFSIDADAKVDHIDNVRRILTGYLEQAWGYSAEDARLLAVFATVYNGVNRGNLDYFKDRYKDVVLSHLSAGNAGLSLRYFEWPGATRLLIPLSEGAAKGDLSALSTTELTEEKVIEDLRKGEDMGLEDRKEMVELKEREVDEKKEELQKEREQVERVREELEEKKEELETGQAATEQLKEVEAKEKELEKAEAEVKEEEQAIKEKEREIADERAGIIADERSKDEKQSTVETGAVVEEKKGPAVFADNLYFLNVQGRSAGGTSSSLSILDPESETVSTSSPITRITRRAFYFFKDRILVVARASVGSSQSKLYLLDPETLQQAAQSRDTVYSESTVLIQSGVVYAVIEAESGGSYRLGKFGDQLELLAGSRVSLDKDTAIALFGSKVYIKAADGKITVLHADDLSQAGVIQ